MRNEPRYEVKSVVSVAQYDRVVEALALHPACFRQAHPTRHIHTVYFDTHDYATFRQNLSGASARVKVRYRWYGDRLTPCAGQLEIKCKRNRTNWKHLFPVARTPYTCDATWRTILAEFRQQLPLQGKMWLNEYPLPMLLNRYRREYFISSDNQIRATIDTEQQSFDQRYKPRPNVLRAINLPKTVVLEIKCRSRDADLASEILSHLPFRTSRHSKYVTGLRAAQGY